ncbi:MAG: hypothetical protein H0Z28_13610 [Archaeoglobus sp.]|nr:hypothetical protein [Archaeoglobus sp.]
MFEDSEVNIQPEFFGKEVFEPPEWKNLWFSGFFILAVGDEAARLVTTMIPAMLRKYIHVICVLADDNKASAVFEDSKHCFRSILVLGLGIDGCGKNAKNGYEIIYPISEGLTFKINKHLNELKSGYGVIPNTFIQLWFSGGTSSGFALLLSHRVREIVRSIDPKANIIDYISISRGDDPQQIANSTLLTLKLLTEQENRRTLILNYFDKESTLKRLSNLNILSTIISLFLSKYRAGIDGMDITDIIGWGGVFTTNTEYRATQHIMLDRISGDNVFDLAKRAVDFEETSFHSRAVFSSRFAERVRISVISPIKILDLGMADKKFEFTHNVMAEGFQLPLNFIPMMATAFLKGNGLAVQRFLQNYRRFALDAEPVLREYLETDQSLENYRRFALKAKDELEEYLRIEIADQNLENFLRRVIE